MEALCDDYVFGQNSRGVQQRDQQGKTKFKFPHVINFDEFLENICHALQISWIFHIF